MEDIVKIIIVDDHKIFRTGLKIILNGINNIKVVAEAADGRELLRLLKTTRTDLIFMDIKMPEIDGIEVTKIVHEKYPEIRIIALTMFGEIEYFNKMIEAGADGFLLKKTQDEELEEAIYEVMAGRNYYSQEFLGAVKQTASRNIDLPIKLSKREIEILELICKGYSNNEIADNLNISFHTVDGHRRNLISKTGVKNAPSLVMYAIKNNLIKT